MQQTIEPKAHSRRQRLLVAEFNVQVYSDGSLDWDGLNRYMDAPEVDTNGLLQRLTGGERD